MQEQSIIFWKIIKWNTIKKDYYFIWSKFDDIGIKRYVNIVNFKNSPILVWKNLNFKCTKENIRILREVTEQKISK